MCRQPLWCRWVLLCALWQGHVHEVAVIDVELSIGWQASFTITAVLTACVETKLLSLSAMQPRRLVLCQFLCSLNNALLCCLNGYILIHVEAVLCCAHGSVQHSVTSCLLCVFSSVGSNVRHSWTADRLSDRSTPSTGDVTFTISSWNWISAAWHKWQARQLWLFCQHMYVHCAAVYIMTCGEICKSSVTLCTCRISILIAIFQVDQGLTSTRISPVWILLELRRWRWWWKLEL